MNLETEKEFMIEKEPSKKQPWQENIEKRLAEINGEMNQKRGELSEVIKESGPQSERTRLREELVRLEAEATGLRDKLQE